MREPEVGLPRPFLIVAAERTGSTLLGRSLNARGDVALAGELFNIRDFNHDQIQWLPGQQVDVAELCRLRREAPYMLLDRLHNTAHELGARAVGFKLLYRHAQNFQRVTDHLIALNVDVIHLRRRDRVARLASLLRSQRADRWVQTGQQGEIDQEPVELPPELCERDFAENAAFEAMVSRLFHGSRRLSLDYESLVQDWPAQMRRVQRFMGLDPQDLEQKTARMAKRPTRELVANWEQLAQHFRDTRWAELFEG